MTQTARPEFEAFCRRKRIEREYELALRNEWHTLPRAYMAPQSIAQWLGDTKLLEILSPHDERIHLAPEFCVDKAACGVPLSGMWRLFGPESDRVTCPTCSDIKAA